MTCVFLSSKNFVVLQYLTRLMPLVSFYTLWKTSETQRFFIFTEGYRNRLMRLICSRRKDHKHYIFHLSWNKKSREEITQKKRTWVWISIGWTKINKKNQAMAKTAKIMNNIAWNRTLSDFLDQVFWFI